METERKQRRRRNFASSVFLQLQDCVLPPCGCRRFFGRWPRMSLRISLKPRYISWCFFIRDIYSMCINICIYGVYVCLLTYEPAGGLWHSKTCEIITQKKRHESVTCFQAMVLNDAPMMSIAAFWNSSPERWHGRRVHASLLNWPQSCLV